MLLIGAFYLKKAVATQIAETNIPYQLNKKKKEELLAVLNKKKVFFENPNTALL